MAGDPIDPPPGLPGRDATLEYVAANDPAALNLLADVVELLEGMTPATPRGMLPAAHGRYEVVADSNRLNSTRVRLSRIVASATAAEPLANTDRVAVR